jgi:hypothetical protein
MTPTPQPEDLYGQPAMQSFVSYAARNPSKPVIPPNQRPTPHVDRASHHAAQVIRQQRQAEFMQDLTEFQANQSKAMVDLATKYNRKPEYMKKILTTESHYKKKRATNLFNAKIAFKRRELHAMGKFISSSSG